MVDTFQVCDVAIAMMYAVLSATNDKPMDAACALLEGYVAKIPLTKQVRVYRRLLAALPAALRQASPGRAGVALSC